jgi:hypothetical protein
MDPFSYLAGLIDPQAVLQNNNFGAGNIPSAQDYEDLRAAQQSFAQIAAYLNGSTPVVQRGSIRWSRCAPNNCCRRKITFSCVGPFRL